MLTSSIIIIHQTHYEKSHWSRSFNQFTVACELDMINAISAADIAFIMSSSTSAWLLSPLESSPQKQNGRTLRFCFWGWIMWKMYNKTIIEFAFRMISWIIKTPCLCYLPQPCNRWKLKTQMSRGVEWRRWIGIVFVFLRVVWSVLRVAGRALDRRPVKKNLNYSCQ